MLKQWIRNSIIRKQLRDMIVAAIEKPKVVMSVPEGMEFGKSYPLNLHTNEKNFL